MEIIIAILLVLIIIAIISVEGLLALLWLIAMIIGFILVAGTGLIIVALVIDNTDAAFWMNAGIGVLIFIALIVAIIVNENLSQNPPLDIHGNPISPAKQTADLIAQHAAKLKQDTVSRRAFLSSFLPSLNNLKIWKDVNK